MKPGRVWNINQQKEDPEAGQRNDGWMECAKIWRNGMGGKYSGS